MNEKINQAVNDIKAGKLVVVLDDHNRENEADLVIAAQKVTPSAINFMITEARGLVCLALTKEKADALELPAMVSENNSKFKTNFTVSIEARSGITTGISAADRAQTILTAVRLDAKPTDLSRPGHIFPVVSHEHGVLGRGGHTEASVELAKLAGLSPAGVMCEILNAEGQSAKADEVQAFAAAHKLTAITVSDIIMYRLSNEVLAERLATAQLPTASGNFTVHAYRDLLTGREHLALTIGELSQQPMLCRVHSSCSTGDIFGSQRCDCQAQLHQSMSLMAQNNSGVLLYLDQEGRGIGLSQKIQAYALQDTGVDTVEANHQLGHQADERHYYLAAFILKDLGITSVELLTNNPQKVNELEACGITVTRKSITIAGNQYNSSYLATKKNKLGHWL